MPLCLLVLRDSPESVGLMADGGTPKPGTTAAPVERVTAGEALRTLAFWQLAGSFFTCGFSMSLLSAHGIPMLTDHGYSPMFASWALGVLGGSSIGFTVMLGLSGLAIGVFKTGALALIGDISTSTAQHTSIMNTAEGFFGVGAIVGPAILARLLTAGLSWTWLYAIAGTICVALIVLALLVKYPETTMPSADSGFGGTGRAMRSPYVLAFSAGAFLYVGVEDAVYVLMPTLLAGYAGSAAALATYSISIFFVLRAAGRFLILQSDDVEYSQVLHLVSPWSDHYSMTRDLVAMGPGAMVAGTLKLSRR